MKKIQNALFSLLFCLLLLFPLGTLAAACFGYTLTLCHYKACGLGLAGIFLLCVGLSLKEDSHPRKGCAVLTSLLPPLTLINGALYFYGSPSPVGMVSMAVCLGCSIVLQQKRGYKGPLNVMSLFLTGLLALLLLFFTFFWGIFGQLSQGTVVQTIPSPHGEYTAQVVSRDQGAMGGNTLVFVYETKSVNAFLFTIDKKPKQVYTGPWLEYEKMDIYWKDETCLVIHSQEISLP